MKNTLIILFLLFFIQSNSISQILPEFMNDTTFQKWVSSNNVSSMKRVVPFNYAHENDFVHRVLNKIQQFYFDSEGFVDTIKVFEIWIEPTNRLTSKSQEDCIIENSIIEPLKPDPKILNKLVTYNEGVNSQLSGNFKFYAHQMAIDEDDVIFVDQWREVPCECKGFDFIYSYNLFQVIEVSNGRIQSKIDYFSPANYGYPGKTKTFFKNINDKENTELLYTKGVVVSFDQYDFPIGNKDTTIRHPFYQKVDEDSLKIEFGKYHLDSSGNYSFSKIYSSKESFGRNNKTRIIENYNDNTADINSLFEMFSYRFFLRDDHLDSRKLKKSKEILKYRRNGTLKEVNTYTYSYKFDKWHAFNSFKIDKDNEIRFTTSSPKELLYCQIDNHNNLKCFKAFKENTKVEMFEIKNNSFNYYEDKYFIYY